MMNLMQDLGPCRRSFALSGPPPATFRAKSGRSGSVPPFEPCDEDLPLQSGYYTFVIDQHGRFRVLRGNTSSHASFVNGGPVASAGSFRIERMGKLAEVFCASFDYRIRYGGDQDRVVVYTIESFLKNPAFDVSHHVIFTFRRGLGDTFALDYNGSPILESERLEKLHRLEEEGCELVTHNQFSAAQVTAFDEYNPVHPPRLYGVHEDQSITALEDDGWVQLVPDQNPTARLTPDMPVMPTGKPNFVIDDFGWLIIGMKHHYLLSGGRAVGGAGHLIINQFGNVDEIQLNYSGHYRPPLSPEYARFVYRTIKGHPLLILSPNCTVKGRRFHDESLGSSVIRFEPCELETDGPESDEQLEMALL
jgi:hypothetical protein